MNTIEYTPLSPPACRAPARHPTRGKARHSRLLGCLWMATALMGALPVGAVEASVQSSLEEWRLRRLNEPTELERRHESEGNVYIYEGLTDREVDQALGTHFDRIEHMMFLGTRRTDTTGTVSNNADGSPATESSGCGH